MITTEGFSYDFSFQNSEKCLEYQNKFQRKLGLYNSPTEEISKIKLRPNPQWTFPLEEKDNTQITLKYQLKRHLLRQFLLDNNLNYLPTLEESRHFDPYNPLRTLDDIENRIASEKALEFEEVCRQTYGWEGYEWYPYSKEEKAYYDYQKHIKEKAKEKAKEKEKRKESIAKSKERKSIQLQKKLFDKYTSKLIENNTDKDKTKEDIINEYLEEHASGTTHLDDNPDDDSWETIQAKPRTSHNKGSYKKSTYNKATYNKSSYNRKSK